MLSRCYENHGWMYQPTSAVPGACPHDKIALSAMQSYSDQQNAELLAWKESAMKELGAIDLQALGKKLGIGLGQSVSENLHAKVDSLLERVKELEVAISKISTITVDDIAFKIAKEALKQEVNND